MVARGLLIFLSLCLSGNCLVNADGYLNILRPRGDLNGTIFDLGISITSGVLNSGYESNAKEFYRLSIVPYGTDKVYISAKVVNSTVRNGKVDSDEYTLELPDQELKDFILTAEGKIVVRKNDPQKNWNFYKTIANFLIFDYEEFKKIENIERSVFSVNLPTIYGRCNIRSVGAITGRDVLEMKQSYDPRTCKDFVSWDFTDFEDVTKVPNLEINNYRKYYLMKKQDSFVLEYINTDQRIYWAPFASKSLKHFLHTSYRFTFAEEASLSLDDTDFDFGNEKNLALTTSPSDYFEEERSFVHLEGMEDLSSETLINEIKNELKNVVNIWNRHLINSTEYNQPIAMELTKTISILEFFKFNQFVSLWEILKTDNSEEGLKILNAYYRIAPLVGTEGSVLFVRKLIIEKIVSLELGDQMLTKLAGSIRQPTMKVLQALKDISDTKTSASLLAYTSALGIAYLDYPGSQKLLEFITEARKDIFTKISESFNNFKDMRLFLQALGNLQFVSLLDEDAQKLLSQVTFGRDEMYMWLLLALEKSTDRHYLFEETIKILREVQRSSELKAVALRIALKSLPTPEDFSIVARIMDASTNYELFNLFESSVRASVMFGTLPESTLPWLRHREPISRSMAFAYDSPNDYPMAFSVKGYLFFDDLTWALQQIYFDVYQSYNGYRIKKYTVFIRLFDMENFSTLKDIESVFMNANKLKYDFTFYRGNRAILSSVDSFDISKALLNFKQLFEDFTLLPFKSHIRDIFQHLNFDSFFPTDAGKDAHLYFNVPWMASAKFNSLKVAEDSVVMNVLASMNYTAQSVTGLHIYQPKLKALQGSRELTSVHFTQQIAFKVYRDTTLNDNFNIFIELTDALTPLYGVRFKKDTLMHLNLIGGEPVAFNKDGNITGHAKIEIGEFYPENRNIDLALVHTDVGAKSHINIFDYNFPPNNKEFPDSLSQIWYKKPFSDILKSNDGDFYVSFLSYINWNFLATSAYSYNFKATLEPCHVFPIRKYAIRTFDQSLQIEFRDKDDKVVVYYKVNDIGPYMNFLRMGPGIESSGFCYREVLDRPGKSEYHFFYGTSSGDLIECPKDQFSLILKTQSQFSSEQLSNRNDKTLSYADCLHKSPYMQLKDPNNNQRCSKAATTLRDMTVNINYKNAPKGLFMSLDQFWMWFLKNYEGIPEENNPSAEGLGDITLRAFYPMTSPYTHLDVFLPDKKFSFKILQNLLTSDNIVFSDFSWASDYFIPAPYCVIVTEEAKLQSSRHLLHRDSNSWIQYAVVKKVSVSVKKVNNLLAVKVLYRDQEITAYPNFNSTSSDKYVITTGENGIDDFPMDWSNRRARTIRVLDTIFFMSDAEMSEQKFIVGYSGERVMIMGANAWAKNVGKCFGLQADEPNKVEL